MNGQTALFGKPLFIIDATCSEKKVWPRIANIRMDVRKEAKPDIVASAAHLPFRDNVFTEIYCDPPHMIGDKITEEKPMMGRAFASRNRKLYPHQHFLHCIGRFGSWKNREEWLDFLQWNNVEFNRTLKSGGKLHYKLCEVGPNSVRFDDMNILNFFKTLLVRETISPLGKNKTRIYHLSPLKQVS